MKLHVHNSRQASLYKALFYASHACNMQQKDTVLRYTILADVPLFSLDVIILVVPVMVNNYPFLTGDWNGFGLSFTRKPGS